MAGIVNENKVVVMTINLWKITKGTSWVRLADTAISRIRREIKRQFRTDADVRIDVNLNKAVWTKGRRSIPSKIRVKVSRRPSYKDNSKTEFYVEHVVVPKFKELLSQSTTGDE
jgi:large subunit ribosomal protein L31e